MIFFLFLLLLIISVLLAYSDWRVGMVLMILVAVLQDPVRKVMSDAPVWMVLAFVPIWLIICIRVFLPNFEVWNKFTVVFRPIGIRMLFLVLALVLAFLVLLANYGLESWKVGVVGGVGYFFPLFAMIIGFFYVRKESDYNKLIWVYAVFTAVFLLGGWFQYLGWFADWKMIGTDALNMTWLRYVPGYVVQLNSGFYRSPDLLGWHAALLVMLSTIMSLRTKKATVKTFWISLVVWGGLVLMISGRNKMIFMPVLFLGVVVLAYTYKSSLNRLASIALTALMVAFMFIGVFANVEVDRNYTMYVSHGTEAVADRVSTSTTTQVITTYQQSGFLGEGLGTASLGSRFGGGSNIKTWQESGLARLLVELGVPGIVAAGAFALSVLLTMLKMLKYLPRNSVYLPVYVGFIGILAANGASFIISHQIFGDPFIIIFTGFLLGLGLSVPFWPQRFEQAQIAFSRSTA